MQYIISFLEGIVTFLSPCLLPMLPVYISYFAGNNREGGTGRTLRNALGFVLGFLSAKLTVRCFRNQNRLKAKRFFSGAQVALEAGLQGAKKQGESVGQPSLFPFRSLGQKSFQAWGELANHQPHADAALPNVDFRNHGRADPAGGLRGAVAHLEGGGVHGDAVLL